MHPLDRGPATHLGAYSGTVHSPVSSSRARRGPRSRRARTAGWVRGARPLRCTGPGAAAGCGGAVGRGFRDLHVGSRGSSADGPCASGVGGARGCGPGRLPPTLLFSLRSLSRSRSPPPSTPSSRTLPPSLPTHLPLSLYLPCLCLSPSVLPLSLSPHSPLSVCPSLSRAICALAQQRVPRAGPADRRGARAARGTGDGGAGVE
jgi:hypothetical protein